MKYYLRQISASTSELLLYLISLVPVEAETRVSSFAYGFKHLNNAH